LYIVSWIDAHETSGGRPDATMQGVAPAVVLLQDDLKAAEL
jgi:hypothetical protein